MKQKKRDYFTFIAGAVFLASAAVICLAFILKNGEAEDPELLNYEMQVAVAREDYELAAKLRDRIKMLVSKQAA